MKKLVHGVCQASWGLGALLGLLAIPAVAQTPTWQAGAAIGGNYSAVEASQTDASGNMVLVGRFSGRVMFGPIALNSQSGTDGFVAKWSSASQSFVWAVPLSSGDDDYALALAVHGPSIYVGGGYRGTMLTAGTQVLTNATPGWGEGYVVKLTDAGTSATVVWSQAVSGSGSEAVGNLAVDGNTVYVGGNFTSVTTQLGPLTIASANGQDNTGHDDSFVARLTDAGSTATWNWARQLGGAATTIEGLACTGGNLYLVGRFTQGRAVFDGITLRAGVAFDTEGWAAKLTDQGTAAATAWAYQLGGPNYDSATAIAVAGNAVYVGGYFSPPSATFGGITIAPPVAYGAHAFVTKLLDAGSTASVAWVMQAGGDWLTNVSSLAVRGASVYVGGGFGYDSRSTSQGPTVFGSTSLRSTGEYDAFVARLVDAGSTASFAWVVPAGGSRSEWVSSLGLSGTKVIVTGSFNSPTLALGASTLSGTSANERSFVAQLVDAAGLAAASPAPAFGAWHFCPNPAHNTATVQLPAAAGAAPVATLTLLDALGRPVRTETVKLAASPTTHPLSLAGLAPGLYLLRLEAGGTTATQRLVVE